MGEVVQFPTPPWWLKFDWGPELGLTSIDSRASVIADMLAACDEEPEDFQRWFDEIRADMRKYYHLPD